MADDTLYYSGLDPLANTFDLGTDPLALRRPPAEARARAVAAHGIAAAAARRIVCAAAAQLLRGLFEVQQSARYAVKYIGGLTLRSDHAGSGRAPLEPVPADKQRAALKLLAGTVFAADSFRFPPSFLRRLAISDSDIDDARDLGRSVPTVDVAVDQQVLAVQRAVLGPLLGPDVAQRLLNNELKVADPTQALRLAELYATLHAADLQRAEDRPGHPAHPPQPAARLRVARRRACCCVPVPAMPADARALLRADAVRCATS